MRHRVSYQFGIIAEGEPGEVVEVETAPLAADKSWFKVEKIIVGDGLKIGGALFCCLRELRSDSPGLPNPRVSVEDATIIVDDDGTVARLRVPFGIQSGEAVKAAIEIPSTGKLFCTLVDPAEEADLVVDGVVRTSDLLNSIMIDFGARIGKRAAEARAARSCPKCEAAIGEWCKNDDQIGSSVKTIHRERF